MAPIARSIKRGFQLNATHASYASYLGLFQTISENSFIWRPKRLVTLFESPPITAFGSEFQTAGAERRKAWFPAKRIACIASKQLAVKFT